MPTYYQRPENALKRANEFIDVGKKQPALDALYDVIKSKKHRTWQKIHEPIMAKYLELCVDLKKSHVAKEGLYQYKNICQVVNIKSLEDVVRRYLQLAETKTEEARNQSHQTVIDVDDLDVIQTPESLLLSAVSGEDTQDRTDRAILTPWVKFLWESYRQCLDLLRNNNCVEKLYQDIAQMAFQFCLKYQRKTEFRKLCENLRTHLSQIHKNQHQQRAINLDKPESQAMHLETRLVQLDSAVHMELWQEAFRAVEDIHGLIQLSKKPPRPSLMANYYQKLALVFAKSGNHLFHACAWHRLFLLSREQRRNLSQEELQRLASRVLCATLAVPVPAAHNVVDQMLLLDENTADKQRRLATLLSLPNPPTRGALVKDLVRYNIMQHVPSELAPLYAWLELEYHPLQLWSRLSAPFAFLQSREELASYVTPLQNVVVVRLLKQVSQIYKTISFDRLAELAPPASRFALERLIVNAAKDLELQVRIDHQKQMYSFGCDLGVSQREDTSEGPYLQSMPTEQIRNQLMHMARALQKSIALVCPKQLKDRRDDLRALVVQSYRQTARKEHARILQRRQIIEERKEELENLNVQREREEQEQVEEQRRRQIEAEMARLEREAVERERQRRLEEHKEIQKKAARERLEQLKSTALGARAFEGIGEEVMADMDVDDILAKQVEQLEKEKKELQEKLKAQEKKVDYFERAKRLEELPLLEKHYEEANLSNRLFWEEQEKERTEQLKAERRAAIAQRDRLSRMDDDRLAFLNMLKTNRQSDYQEKLEVFEEQVANERKLKLALRREERKMERRQRWLQEKEDEAQRLRDEEMKREREEAERAAQAQREKEDAEYRERLLKLEEIEKRKREREREIEERRQGEAERVTREDRSERPSGAWRPSGGESRWRERVKEKEDSWRSKDVGSCDADGEEPHDEARREPERRFDMPRDARLDEPPSERGWRSSEDDRWREPKGDGPRDGWRDKRPPPSRDAGREDGWRGRGGDDWRSGGQRDSRSRDERDFRDDRGPRSFRDDRGPRDFREDRGPRDFRDDRGPRDFRDDRGPRDFRDDRGPRDFRDDRGPRDFRDDRGPRDFRDDRGSRSYRDDRGPRDFRDDRGPRDFRDDRGPRDFRDDRGSRDFRDNRGPRDVRDDRGPRDGPRDFRDDRGPRDFRDDRGSRDFRDDRGPRDVRDDHGPRDFRDDRGPKDYRDERGPKDFADDRGPRDDRREPPRDDWRSGKGSDRRPADSDSRARDDKAPETQRRDAGSSEQEGWTTVHR